MTSLKLTGEMKGAAWLSARPGSTYCQAKASAAHKTPRPATLIRLPKALFLLFTG